LKLIYSTLPLKLAKSMSGSQPLWPSRWAEDHHCYWFWQCNHPHACYFCTEQ